MLLQPELAVGDPTVPVPVHDLDHLVNFLQPHLHPALRSALLIGTCNALHHINSADSVVIYISLQLHYSS